MESCDTFVVMSDLTAPGDVIFGKNSDRPVGEVQEVVRIPSKNHKPNSNVHVSTLTTYLPGMQQGSKIRYGSSTGWG